MLGLLLLCICSSCSNNAPSSNKVGEVVKHVDTDSVKWNMADLENFSLFEIVELPTNNRPFKEFRIYGFNFYDKRTSSQVEKLSKPVIKWKGLEADLVELNLISEGEEKLQRHFILSMI